MSKKTSISLIIAFILFVGLWIWTLVMPNSGISIGGSSSADPVIQRLTNKYKTEYNQNFIYSSTGSQAGISNIENGVYKAGFISKSVPGDLDAVDDLNNFYKNAQEHDKTEAGYLEYLKKAKENNEKIHYSTFAKDSLVFVYNDEGINFEKYEKVMTLTLKQNTKDDSSTDNIENNQIDDPTYNILKEMYTPNSPNNLMTWKDLAEKMTEKAWKDKIINWAEYDELINYLPHVSDQKINPYSTPSGSGTRSSFIKIARNIEIGEAINIYSSNGSIFAQISRAGGNFGFVSMSYAKALADASLNLNVKAINIVIPQKDSKPIIQNPIQLYKEKKLEEYTLTREFNVLFNLQQLTLEEIEKIGKFVYYISVSGDADDAFYEEGLIRTWKVVNPIDRIHNNGENS